MVEDLEDLLPAGQIRNLVRLSPNWSDIQRRLRQRVDEPFGKVRHVVGVPADRVRLGMRLPVELIIWNPLEHLARVCHFLIELGQRVSA